MLKTKINQHGFTFLEQIVALIVISILATIIVIKWPDNTSINLNTQAELVASDVRYTQNLAMTRSERFSFEKYSGTSYQIKDSTNNPVSVSSGNSTGVLNSGIYFDSFTNLSNNMVVFDSKGVPYIDNLGTPLAEIAIISIVASGITKKIAIYPETGWVTCGDDF